MYDNAEPPPQRRDNGLRADTFVALADVDPRLGEHLLDLLRLADIAAYLEPPADPRIATRHRVAGPIERLFVQSDLRRAAREVVLAAAREAGADTGAALSEAEPGGNERSSAAAGASSSEPTRPNSGHPVHVDRPDPLAGIDTDAEFARIMAGYDVAAPSRRPAESGSGPARDGTSRTHAADNAEPGNAEAGNQSAGDVAAGDEDTGDRTARGQAARDGGSHRGGTDTGWLVAGVTGDQLDANADAVARSETEAAARAAAQDDQREDEQDHFIPPPAPPFPIPRGETVGAMALLLFGLLVIARGDWLGLGSNASFPIGVVLVLTAIMLLIKGLQDPEPDDADPDDGAIV